MTTFDTWMSARRLSADVSWYVKAGRYQPWLEHLVRSFKQLGRVVSCHKQRALHFLTIVTLAAILLWIYGTDEPWFEIASLPY
ncbi:MAG: hypothetical protein J2P37_32940 [Ktedonobacteraceae bacterium]|nr:hypothetical protein [Ktedonobacteraceae bacterium]